MGETREVRIIQFLEENDTPVAGLREGAMLLVAENSVKLKGVTGARIFRKGQPPIEASPGAEIHDLLCRAAGENK
jgi:dipeptidase E